MTDQELFDRVAKHLLRQGAKSFNAEETMCAYRGPKGLKCAIGALIPDEMYEERWEGSAIDLLGIGLSIASAAGISREQIGLASQLQCIHDNDDPDEWPEKLAELAAMFELSAEVVP